MYVVCEVCSSQLFFELCVGFFVQPKHALSLMVAIVGQFCAFDQSLARNIGVK